MTSRLVALGLLCCATNAVSANTEDAIQELIGIQERVQKVLPDVRKATVGILAPDGTGSGVVVSQDGLVLTAGHVSGKPGQDLIVVFEDGRKARAKSLGRTALSDAGMLKIEGDETWPTVELAGKKENVSVGDWVFALGHPGGLDSERGTVFRYGKIIRIQKDTLQSDCKLQGGDSGGPLFNLRGKVVGIHSRIWRPMDHNFHVSLNAFQDNWDKMIQGKVIKGPNGEGGGFLGAGATTNDDGGVLVEQIIPGSAAEEYGLKLGDVIQKIAGKKIESTEEFSKTLRGMEAGDEVEIEVKRGKKLITLEIMLGRRPG